MLKDGTSVKACTANKSKLSNVIQAKLTEELVTLDTATTRCKTEKAARQKDVKDMELSARTCKQQKFSKYTKSKDKLDMDYCRMVVVTACNAGLLPLFLSPISTGFMESEFVASFFVTLNYDIPSRTIVNGALT